MIATGLVLCLVPIGYFVYGSWQQDQLTRQWQREVKPHPTPTPIASPGAPVQQPVPPPRVGYGQVAFAIRVPRIGYYAAVREGVTDDILYSGPGRYPETALPGQQGTVGVAAHNTYWVRFGDLGRGDEIVLETRTGDFHYRITGSQVVHPGARWVLEAPPGTRRLVLTTCWPLWAGALAQDRLAIFTDQTT
jgi:LPXTG-site transpeptidase (sortase) family protein